MLEDVNEAIERNTKEVLDEIGNVFKEFRREKHLSLTDTARYLHMPIAELEAIENAESYKCIEQLVEHVVRMGYGIEVRFWKRK